MVYKLSDVKLMTHPKNALDVENNNNKIRDNNNKLHHCASERLYRKMLQTQETPVKKQKLQEKHQKSDLYNYYKKVLLGDKSRSNSSKIKEFKRRKRWLNDEVSSISFRNMYHQQ